MPETTPLPPAILAELERRIAALDANPEKPPVLESKLEELFADTAALVGGLAFKTVSTKGFPDRCLFTPDGRLEPVELKRLGEGPSAIQRVVHGLVAARNHRITILHGKREILAWYAAGMPSGRGA